MLWCFNNQGRQIVKILSARVIEEAKEFLVTINMIKLKVSCNGPNESSLTHIFKEIQRTQQRWNLSTLILKRMPAIYFIWYVA